jgi:hypothetical protein
LYFEFLLAYELKRTYAELYYADDGPMTQDEFSLWPHFFRAKAFLEDQATKKASKSAGGRRYRY